MNRQELIDFLDWQDENPDKLGSTNDEIADFYLKVKSINSTRRSERRANGSNSKEKEVCPKTGFCNIAEQYGFCPYQCALFNREQTD